MQNKELNHVQQILGLIIFQPIFLRKDHCLPIFNVLSQSQHGHI